MLVCIYAYRAYSLKVFQELLESSPDNMLLTRARPV